MNCVSNADTVKSTVAALIVSTRFNIDFLQSRPSVSINPDNIRKVGFSLSH